MEAEVTDPVESNHSESREITTKKKSGPLQVSVNEKVIFCIDTLTLVNCVGQREYILDIFNMLTLYIDMKRKISIKPVEFQCLLLGDDKIVNVSITNAEDLLNSIKAVNFIEKEVKCFDFSILFSTLADSFALPDPKIYSETIPPPFVYHCILIFGHNLYVPIMKETNAFDFLMQNPFFAFDTIYIYNDLKGNNCELIARALSCLYESENGYFFIAHVSEIDKQYDIFAKCLGHPLIRCPQSKSKFSLKELSSSGNMTNDKL